MLFFWNVDGWWFFFLKKEAYSCVNCVKFSFGKGCGCTHRCATKYKWVVTLSNINDEVALLYYISWHKICLLSFIIIQLSEKYVGDIQRYNRCTGMYVLLSFIKNIGIFFSKISNIYYELLSWSIKCWRFLLNQVVFPTK